MSIIAEAPGLIQVFSDGSVKRFSPEIAWASPESIENYKSKDIVIDPSKPITGRMFLPNSVAADSQKLPVVVYFHGGGFCIGSTTWVNYHIFLGDLASQSGAIILSIDYRLAPENRLPVAYLDGLTSLEWLSKNSNSEPWLKRADLSRVFLSGDSAGGNLAHNVAVETLKTKNDLGGVTIKGLLLIHPYFGSEKRTSQEVENSDAIEVQLNDMFWKLSIPEGSNRDYIGCNFEMNEVSKEIWDEFPSVVVFVAENDFLMERGVMYVEFLRKKLVENLKLIEAKDEGHVFHVYYPKSEATRLLQCQMTDFINSLY